MLGVVWGAGETTRPPPAPTDPFCRWKNASTKEMARKCVFIPGRCALLGKTGLVLRGGGRPINGYTKAGSGFS